MNYCSKRATPQRDPAVRKLRAMERAIRTHRAKGLGVFAPLSRPAAHCIRRIRSAKARAELFMSEKAAGGLAAARYRKYLFRLSDWRNRFLDLNKRSNVYVNRAMPLRTVLRRMVEVQQMRRLADRLSPFFSGAVDIVRPYGIGQDPLVMLAGIKFCGAPVAVYAAPHAGSVYFSLWAREPSCTAGYFDFEKAASDIMLACLTGSTDHLTFVG